MLVTQERCIDGDIPGWREADPEVAAQLARCARGDGHDPCLVELRLADAQRPVPEIDIGEREPGELAAAHPGGVEQNERDAVRGLVQRMLNALRPGLDRIEHPCDLARAKDRRVDRWQPSGEIERIVDEAVRRGAPPIQAELADNEGIASTRGATGMPEAPHPGLEPLGTQLVALGQKARQSAEHISLSPKLKPQRALMTDVAHRAALNCGDRDHETHDTLPSCSELECAGTGRATSRKASVLSRRYTAVLSRVRCPRRSPMALMPTPLSSSRMAKPCRSPYGE